MLSLRSAVLCALAGAFLVSLGCGNSNAPAMGDFIEVSGTVTTSTGTPMKAGTIHFKPDGAGREELCVVNDGKFSLKMFAGKYKVAFDLEEPRSTVPAKFRSYATADKSAEVKGSKVELKFELK